MTERREITKKCPRQYAKAGNSDKGAGAQNWASQASGCAGGPAKSRSSTWRERRDDVSVDEQVNETIDWTEVQDAYGSAEAVPGLLDQAAGLPSDAGVWNDLWSRLCHQGTVYQASFLAIPALGEMARLTPPMPHSQALNLLAAIAGSTDVSGTPDTRERYADALASCLPAAEAYAAAAADDTDFCYALSVVAGLRGERVWHQVLTFLADGTVPGGCPECGEDLCVFLDTIPARVCLSWVEPPDGPELVLAKADTIEGYAQGMLVMAGRHSRGNVTHRLLALLGDGQCPACERPLSRGSLFGLGVDDAQEGPSKRR